MHTLPEIGNECHQKNTFDQSVQLQLSSWSVSTGSSFISPTAWVNVTSKDRSSNTASQSDGKLEPRATPWTCCLTREIVSGTHFKHYWNTYSIYMRCSPNKNARNRTLYVNYGAWQTYIARYTIPVTCHPGPSLMKNWRCMYCMLSTTSYPLGKQQDVTVCQGSR
jgi:hypothetical protein